VGVIRVERIGHLRAWSRVAHLPLSSCAAVPGGCEFRFDELCGTRFGPCRADRITVPSDEGKRLRHRRGVFLLYCDGGGLNPFVYPGFHRPRR
jgi:hypothetical protein